MEHFSYYCVGLCSILSAPFNDRDLVASVECGWLKLTYTIKKCVCNFQIWAYEPVNTKRGLAVSHLLGYSACVGTLTITQWCERGEITSAAIPLASQIAMCGLCRLSKFGAVQVMPCGFSTNNKRGRSCERECTFRDGDFTEDLSLNHVPHVISVASDIIIMVQAYKGWSLQYVP